MEKSDLELIRKYAKNGDELTELYENHLKLDEEVDRIQSLEFMTQEEIQKLKILKKAKLEGRDKMEEILKNFRSEDNGLNAP